MTDRLLLLGDLAFSGLISAQPHENQMRFQNIRLPISAMDYVFANLESPAKATGEVNERKAKKSGIIIFSEEDVLKYLLPYLNIKGVSLANNHIYDQKEAGLRKTIDIVKELDIQYTGVEFNGKDVVPIIFHLGRKRIAILSYVHLQTKPMFSNYSTAKLNVFNESKILKEILRTKKLVDYVMLSLHWGNEYSFYPTELQVTSARRFIDAGVRIVMGHHPHTMQPYEKYRDGWIFYSLGQLCFGDFIWEGRLRALKIKTKRASFTVFDENLNLVEFITTKELKGNHIKIIKWNYKLWSKLNMKIAQLMFRYRSIRIVVSFKEAFIDRLYEYFFGYYRNPFKQLFRLFVNFKKIRYLKRDFKKYSNGI